jgi:hypothetical protein
MQAATAFILIMWRIHGIRLIQTYAKSMRINHDTTYRFHIMPARIYNIVAIRQIEETIRPHMGPFLLYTHKRINCPPSGLFVFSVL